MARASTTRGFRGPALALSAALALLFTPTRAPAPLGGGVGQGTAAAGMLAGKGQAVGLTVTNLHADLSCEFQLIFLSREGTVLGEPELVLLAPGHTASASFAVPRKLPAKQMEVVAGVLSLTDGCETTARATAQVTTARSGKTVSVVPLSFQVLVE